MDIVKRSWGQISDGSPVDLYTMTNARGMEAKITNYGGTVVSLWAADRHGNREDVVVGYDTLEGYVKGRYYFGCIVGRYANRIDGGRFTLNGRQYRLAANEGGNHLHGGFRGFDKVVWQTEIRDDGAGKVLKLTYLSPDGEEGYPGNLSATVIFRLTDANELRIDYHAFTDAPTVVNLTHHMYFNLAGAGSGDILGHRLMIDAERFTPVDSRLIPTGELRNVKGTPMDFTRPIVIGARISQDDAQLLLGKGYDHNWVLNKDGPKPAIAARVLDPGSGRTLEVHTTEPGVQFYSGNYLDDGIAGKGGRTYNRRGGFCLETQHFPDSPNKPHFPSTVLETGNPYRQTTVYRLAVGS